MSAAAPNHGAQPRNLTDGVLKRFVRAVAPFRIRYWWRLFHEQRWVIRSYGLPHYLYLTGVTTFLWVKAWLGWRQYRVLSEEELLACRRSDKVFVFGSGYSLNDIGPEEWRHIAEHDVFGFSGFIYQNWVRVDFHLFRAWAEGGVQRCRRAIRTYAKQLLANPRFNSAVLLVQRGYPALSCNELIGHGVLPTSSRLFAFKTVRPVDNLPSRRFRDGVTHVCGTLLDSVNVAYLMGWKHIVLVGVDLHDARYFWGPPDRTLVMSDEGEMVPSVDGDVGRWDEPHSNMHHRILEVVALWRDVLACDGIALSVYNPRSLLAGLLPVYEPPCSRRVALAERTAGQYA